MRCLPARTCGRSPRCRWGSGHRVAIAAVPMRDAARPLPSDPGRGRRRLMARRRRRRGHRRRARRAPRRPPRSPGPATRSWSSSGAAAWRWRAGGVFASPASIRELRRLGLDEPTLRRVARPIPAMRVESPRGTAFRLTYGADGPGARPAPGRPGTAVGFDRSALDPALLELARSAGADVRCGVAVRRRRAGRAAARDQVVETGRRGRSRRGWSSAPTVRGPWWRARRASTGRPSLGGRVGLTWHVDGRARRSPEGRADGRAARRRVLRDRARAGRPRQRRHRARRRSLASGAWRPTGPRPTAERVLAAVPPLPGDPEAWRAGRATDAIAGASPLGCRVARRAGAGWVVVGDAAGFLDPFTGEGLHRALVSARLAAAAIDGHLRGTGRDRPRCLRPGDAGPVHQQGRGLAAGAGVPRPAAAVRAGGPEPRRSRGHPCDDGPRDGRPRPGVARPGPAVPRRAPRAVTADPAAAGGIVQRTRLAAYAWCEAEDAVLLCRIAPGYPDPGAWTLPGGGLDFGEDPADGVLRELREETGLGGQIDGLLGDLVGDPRARGHRRAVTGSTSSGSCTGSRRTGRAARRARRLDRSRRVDPVRAPRRAAPRRPRRLGPRLGGPLSDALDDRDRRRRAAGARVPARPRRHPLGAPPPPLRAIAA